MQIHGESNSITTDYIRYLEFCISFNIRSNISRLQLGMSVSSMVIKCRNRTVEVMTSVSYLMHDGVSQATKTKLIYRTLLACFGNIVNFWSKMMMMEYNEINAKLKITKKASAFLEIGQADRRVSFINQLDRSHRRCQFLVI
jgi:hypothetical protein